MRAKERLTSGRCWACDGPAKGGAMFRRGVETVPLCPGCSQKDEADLYITHGQARQLVEAARKMGGRYEEIIILGLNLGVRIGELVMLKGTDFQWDEGRVLVTTLKRRGRQPRLPVYISPALAKVLKKIVGAKRGFLFPRRSGARGKKRGGHISRWMASRMFRAVRDEAGLSGRISPHAMRHYCAIKLLEATGDIEFVSRQLRHASIATTQKYLHLLPERAASRAAMVKPTR